MIALLNRFNAKLHGLQLYRTGRWFIQHESPCNERWPSRVKAAKSVKTGRLVEKITSRHSGRQSVMNSENLLWNKKKRSFHVLNDLFSCVSFPHLLHFISLPFHSSFFSLNLLITLQNCSSSFFFPFFQNILTLCFYIHQCFCYCASKQSTISLMGGKGRLN